MPGAPRRAGGGGGNGRSPWSALREPAAASWSAPSASSRSPAGCGERDSAARSSSPSTCARATTRCARRALRELRARVRRHRERRGVAVECEAVLRTANAAPCDPALQAALADASPRKASRCATCRAARATTRWSCPRSRRSAMLFVRCGNSGISHHPRETMTAEDAEIATSVLLHFLENYGRRDEHRSRRRSTAGSTRATPNGRVPARARPRAPRHAARRQRAGTPRRRAALLERSSASTVERHPVPARSRAGAGMKSVTNLIVRHRFGSGGPTIALNAHGDVVPPGEGWTGAVRGRRRQRPHVRPRRRGVEVGLRDVRLRAAMRCASSRKAARR